jgi:hypothetical protein
MGGSAFCLPHEANFRVGRALSWDQYAPERGNYLQMDDQPPCRPLATARSSVTVGLDSRYADRYAHSASQGVSDPHYAYPNDL